MFHYVQLVVNGVNTLNGLIMEDLNRQLTLAYETLSECAYQNQMTEYDDTCQCGCGYKTEEFDGALEAIAKELESKGWWYSGAWWYPPKEVKN
jgi:hypothetical protein